MKEDTLRCPIPETVILGEKQLGIVTHTCNCSTWEAETGDCCKFEAIQDYIVSS